ncbi:MAG: hypothetical protein JWM99_515 [Verrucomicrobiales bacterium]|nr:hypothetical protein [Verrucomicrobiales bacterium]
MAAEKIIRGRWTAQIFCFLLTFCACESVFGQAIVKTIGGAFAGYVDGDNNSSQFNNPAGCAVDRNGNLYIADLNNNVVRLLRTSDDLVSTFIPPLNRANPLSQPVAVAVDSVTNIYVVNQGNGTVLRFDRFGNTTATVASQLLQPTAVGVGSDFSVYVTELNGRVLRYTTNSSGSYNPAIELFRVSDLGTQLRGVAVLNSGQVIVTDSGWNVIRLYQPQVGLSILSGIANRNGDFADGARGIARFNQPWQVARVGTNGTVAVADRFNHRVRAVACDGTTTTLYGIDPALWETAPDPDSGIYPGWADGSTQFAEAREPVGVAVSEGLILYTTEAYYHLARSVTGLSYPAGDCGSGNGGTNVIPSSVPIPVLNPNSGFFPNGVTITVTASNTLAGFGPDAEIFYTLDGTEPTRSSLPVQISGGVGTIFIPGPIDLSQIRVKVFIGAASSPTTPGQPTKIPVPVITPGSGYFPMGTKITVTASNSPSGFVAGTQLFYTTDGSDPTTNSPSVLLNPDGTGTIIWHNALADLSSLRIKAFDGPNQGPTISGGTFVSSTASVLGEVGIAGGLGNGQILAGIGSSNVIAVVANMKSGVPLRSLQFVAEVVPIGSAPAATPPYGLHALLISTNDFIQVRSATLAPATAIAGNIGSTNRIAIAYFGTNSFLVQNSAVVSMLALQVPPNASEGDEYEIRISQISGTTDGVQNRVALSSMPVRRIHIQNLSYLVGDSASGFWYNAGDFGDEFLDNSDVNNALFASLGLRVPYSGSDVFNAMDAFPAPRTDGPPTARAGGDNQIRFLDWQTILNRSLGFDQNNWRRQWSAGGVRIAAPTVISGTPLVAAESLAMSGSGTVWNKDAILTAGTVANVAQGNVAHVPIYLASKANVSVVGLQFLAYVDGSPAVPNVQFTPASGMPAPDISGNSVPGAGVIGSGLYCAWSIDSFVTEPAATTLLGYLDFQIPLNAGNSQSYTIRFGNADGAGSEEQAFNFETIRGAAWVNSPALIQADTISDEWKIQFFGSTANPAAASTADPDGDGLTNYQEYLAGTNPAGFDWNCQVSGDSFRVRYFANAGTICTVERSSDLEHWQVVATVSGDNALHEYAEQSAAHEFQYYRVKVAP